MAEEIPKEAIRGVVGISIMHVLNAGKYWVTEPIARKMSEDKRAVHDLEDKLTVLYKDSFGIPYNFPENKLIAVKDTRTGIWHRGELTHIPETSIDRVKVFLVDHGEFLVDVSSKHLQILPKEMHDIPHQAFIVCLYGLIPLTVDVCLEDINDKMHYEESPFWTPASEIFVQELISDSISAKVKYVAAAGNIVHGEVILKMPGQGSVSLNEELIKNNFAYYSEEKYKKVMERELLFEKKLKAQRKIFKSKVDEKENDEESGIHDVEKLQEKPMLMEDFLKEYASKKSARGERASSYLSEIRSVDLNSFQKDDIRIREELKNSILYAPPNPIGRGFSLRNARENALRPPHIGRGYPLPISIEQEVQTPASRSHPSNRANYLIGLLDLLNCQGNSKEEADKEMGNSVLSLGQIPAGYPLDFSEAPVNPERKTSNKSGKVDQKTSLGRRTIPLQQSENSVPRRVPMRPDDNDGGDDTSEFQNENLATSYERELLKEITSVPSNEIYNANAPQIVTKALGLKSDKECFWNEKSASVSQQEGNNVEACHTFNRKGILKIIKNYPKNSQRNLSMVASNDRVVNLQEDDLRSDSPHLRKESEELTCQNTKEEEILDKMGCSSQSLLLETKPASFPEKKILKLMKLQSQSDIPHTAIKEEGTIPSSMSKKKESENKPPDYTQRKVTTPLHLLLGVMRKKKEVSYKKVSENSFVHLEECNDHQTGNVSERDVKTNSEISVVSEVDCNLGNKSFEGCSTNVCDGKNSAAPSDLISEIVGCKDNRQSVDNNANMTLKETIEEKNSVVNHVETNRISLIVSNNGVNNSNVNREEKDIKVISEHASQVISSPPQKIKAAIDMFAEAMRELESSNGDNPYVRNLTSLKKELESIRKRVIEQSRNEPKDEKQNSSDFKIEPESLISHSPVEKESFISEEHNISNEKITSVHGVCEKEKVMTTSIVETGILTRVNDENLPSKTSSVHNNFNVESYSPSSHHDSSIESSVGEITGSGLNNTSEKVDCNYYEENSRDSPKVTSTEDTESKHVDICATKSAETEVKCNIVEVCKILPSGTVEMNKPKENSEFLSVLNPKCDPHSSVLSKTETVLSNRNQVLDNSAAQGTQSILNDDFVSKKISSFAKLMSRIEAEEKSKTYNAIKVEGVPISSLSARLPLCALSDLNKSKGSRLSLNSNISSLTKPNLPSASADIEAMKIQKQKTLEPELVSPQVAPTDNLPPLLKNSWLSGLGMEDCFFSAQRLRMCRILVRGHFLAQRITSIAQATFSKPIHMSLSKMGFRDPMRIQTYAWPALMRGHNLIMVNPPRSGKTLAYLVPIVSFMLSSDLYSELPVGNGPLVLILCPSWKGVMQVKEFCNCLLSEIDSQVKVIATYGGIEIDEILSLINGCHILISTPKCYLRILKNDSITTNVERLCHLVLDGADVLMKDFMPEVKEVLRECRLLLQRRARLAAEANSSKETQSYTMVKIVAAAKSWCPQMESFVTNIVEKPLLCIGSYLEAAVYARLKPVLHLVGFSTSKGGERKEVVNESPRKKCADIDEVVVGILKEKVGFYKIVVACDSEVEVKRLAPKIRALGRDVLEVHENVHHVDRADVLDFWMSSNRYGTLPVMIISDEALPEISIGDAEHLVHVGIPTASKTQFGLRFSTLMDNYRDIFEKVSTDEKNESTKNCFVDIIADLTETDVDISGLIDFLQRLGMTIPPELDAAASKSMMNREKIRKKDVALCPSLKSFGVCSESICSYRHVVLADVDKPSEGIPTCGEVQLKILNVLDASHMSVRLLEHIAPDGTKTSLPNDYYFIASGLDRYFGRVGNRIAHGHPRVGDLCAYEVDVNLFHRARVESVFYSCPDIKVPEYVALNIIDKGIKIKTKANSLLYLPDDLKKYPAQAQELIVCKMRPRDLDETWSKAACIKVAKWLECEVKGEIEGKVIIGKVMFALGNTMWVDPLECQEWLENHKTTVIHLSLRHDLIRAGLAIDNPNHTEALKKLCDIADLQFPSPQPNKDVVEKDKTETNMKSNGCESNPSQLELDKPKSSPVLEWLSSEKLIEVNVSDVNSPSCFRLQKASNSERLKELSKEIQLWISDFWQESLSKNPDNIKEYSIDSLCLGFLEADNSWHRAKVISVIKSLLPTEADSSHLGTESANNVKNVKLLQYKLYFVDYGDIAIVSSHEIVPIPDKFISQLPFQAIECSLLGVSPLEEDSASDSSNYSNVEWNQDACDAFYELCREGENLDIFRPLLAKVFGSDGTSLYGGTKYLVVLYDIGSKCPTRVGDLLAERGFAKSYEVVSDIEYDNDDVLEEKDMDFNWIEEGALVPLTPALTPAISLHSNENQLESSVISSEDSNCTALVASKGSWNDYSENRQSSADDEDSDGYEVVMTDDEVDFYEDRLRRLLGIPPREPVTEPRGENNSLRAIEKFSSPERTFEDGGNHSSSTSFEDLTGSIQRSCERVEEILEENGEELVDPKTTLTANEEHKTAVNIDGEREDDSEIGDNIQCLQSSKSKNLNIEYLSDKSASSKLDRDESSVLNIDDSTKDHNISKENDILSSDCGSTFSLMEDASDIMDEKISSEIVIKDVPEKDSIISPSEKENFRSTEVEDLGFSIRNKPDKNPSNVKSFSANVICDKLNEEIQDDYSLEDAGSCNLKCEQPIESLLTVPIKSVTDHISPEEDVAISIMEKEDVEELSDANKLTEITNKENPKFFKEVLECQKDISANVDEVQCKDVEVATVEENSEHEVQLKGVNNSEIPFNSVVSNINNTVNENSDVLQSKASDAELLISTSSELTTVPESNINNASKFNSETDLKVTDESENNITLCDSGGDEHNGSIVDECFKLIPDENSSGVDNSGSSILKCEEPMESFLTVPIKSVTDHISPEEDVAISIIEKEGNEALSDAYRLPEKTNKEVAKIVKDVLECQKDISANVDEVQCKTVEAAMVEENSKLEVQITGVSNTEIPFNSVISDINSTVSENSDVLQSKAKAPDAEVLISTSSESNGVSESHVNNETKSEKSKTEEGENNIILCNSEGEELNNKAARVEENSEHKIQLSGVIYTEMPSNSGKCIHIINNIIDDKSDVVELRAEDLFLSTSSEVTIDVSDVSDINDASKAITEETDLNVTEEGEKNLVLSNFEDEQHNGSTVVECFEVMPELIPAKFPAVKWGQNKREVILMLNLPNMNRYNVHWEENNKLYIFASSDIDSVSPYMVELLLWAPVDVENCEHMAISDNIVKVYLRKAFAIMEWPRLLLEPIKPLWLSVDFDMVEFEEEDFSEDVTTRKLVRYPESEDESYSEDDMEPDNGLRCEEINYDPHDPLS